VNEIQKFTAYITREDQLLVFRQPGSPEVSIQVPAGTLKSEEKPARRPAQTVSPNLSPVMVII